MAVKVELVDASLNLGGLSITEINGSFQINSASGQHDSNGGQPTDGTITSAVALDWRSALDLDDDGVFSENGDPTSETTDDVLVVGTETIDLVGTGMRVSGSAELDVFGILTGDASFALTNRLVDVDLDGVAGGESLDNATLTLVAISDIDLSFGTPDAGLDIGPGGTIGIAILKAPVTATDTRTWMAVVAKNLAIAPNLPGIGGQIVNGSLKINRVSGARNNVNLTDADALNWATEAGLPLTIDLNEAGSWTAPTALVDPGAALPTPTFLPVTLRGAQTAVAGTLQNLSIFGFVTGSASFAMQSRLVDVDLDANGNGSDGDQLNDATLLTIALDQLNLSIGAAGAGLSVTSGRLGIAVLTPPKTATDDRSWLALSASNLGITLSVAGITATVTNGSLLLNQASPATNTRFLDWATPTGPQNTLQNLLIDFNPADGYTSNPTQFVDPASALSQPVTTPPTPPITMPITVRGQQMAVSGTLSNLNVFDVLTGGASFALVTQQVDVDLDGLSSTTDDRLDNATLLTFGLSNLSLTVGGGATDTRSWTAVTANNLSITLALPTDLMGSPSLTNVTLQMNKFAGQYQAPTPAGGGAPPPALAQALPGAIDH